MKKNILILIFGLIVGIFGFNCSNDAYALIIIDAATDSFTVGDFLVTGSNEPTGSAGTGRNYEILKYSVRGSGSSGTAFDGSSFGGGFQDDQAPNGDVNTGDLWTHLDDNGVTSATSLLFGFDTNQGPGETIDIDSLIIKIYDGLTFSEFNTNETIRVFEYHIPGSSVAEANFKIDLGFDFIQKYSASSTDNFFIQATHSNEKAGFDEYFLIGADCENGDGCVIPEPSTILLFTSGVFGLFFRKRLLFLK